MSAEKLDVSAFCKNDFCASCCNVYLNILCRMAPKESLPYAVLGPRGAPEQGSSEQQSTGDQSIGRPAMYDDLNEFCETHAILIPGAVKVALQLAL